MSPRSPGRSGAAPGLVDPAYPRPEDSRNRPVLSPRRNLRNPRLNRALRDFARGRTTDGLEGGPVNHGFHRLPGWGVFWLSPRSPGRSGAAPGLVDPAYPRPEDSRNRPVLSPRRNLRNPRLNRALRDFARGRTTDGLEGGPVNHGFHRLPGWGVFWLSPRSPGRSGAAPGLFDPAYPRPEDPRNRPALSPP